MIVLAERLSLGALREQIEKTECLAEAARLRGEEALGLAGDALVALQNARLRNDEDKKEMLRLRKELNASHKRSQEIWAEYEAEKAKYLQRINALKAEADREHKIMSELFDRACQEYDDDEKDLAHEHSVEGHGHEARLKELNAQVVFLFGSLKSERRIAERRIKRLSDNAKYHEAKKTFEKSSEECESLRKDYYELYRRGMSERRSRESLMKELESLRAELEKKVAELFILNNRFPRDGTYEGEIDGKPAIVKISDSGNSNQMQVFYGGEDVPDGPGHSHINVIDGQLRYWREDGVVIFQDSKKNQSNNI